MELEAQRTHDTDLLLEAMDLVDQPVPAPTVIVQRTVPKVAGISFRENWKYRVVDAAKISLASTSRVDDVKIGAVCAR
jgi:hypothetical protein